LIIPTLTILLTLTEEDCSNSWNVWLWYFYNWFVTLLNYWSFFFNK